MAGRAWTAEEDMMILAALGPGRTPSDVAEKVSLPGRQRDAIRQRVATLLKDRGGQNAPATKPGIEIEVKGESQVITAITSTVRTLEDALKVGKVDLAVWEVERHVINKWDSVALVKDNKESSHLVATELWQVKVWLKRKDKGQLAIEALLQQLEKTGPIVARIKRSLAKAKAKTPRRALEIAIMDPHLGLRCFAPAADKSWDIDQAESACLWAVDELIAAAKPFGEFEEVVFPFGNDWLHHDTVFHTTTAGTMQPEGDAWHETYLRAETLAIEIVNRLKEVAPVKIFQIPGNHDRQSAFTLGRVLRAYFLRDKNVEVDASPSPYKFWRYGVNLIGFEHGHSVSAIRLAALMANERREDWAETSYREWHLGDQHRKGSSKPSSFEEQGVSVEYLPSLTAPNEWHRLKAFNWQKRGAMAFVWDKDRGPLSRLQVNWDSYADRPMGRPMGRKTG